MKFIITLNRSMFSFVPFSNILEMTMRCIEFQRKKINFVSVSLGHHLVTAERLGMRRGAEKRCEINRGNGILLTVLTLA